MAHLSSPSKKGALVNPVPLNQHDTQQGSRKNYRAWKNEIAGKVISITNPVSEFLEHFVPGEKPSKSVAQAHFQMPLDARREDELYDPLCKGFTSLVNRLSAGKKPIFVNHNHKRIKFPYGLAASKHHITRPDIIASFPGETSIGEHVDYWRNISFVAEVKLTEGEDPMTSCSEEHEKTLVQLAKSARNLLVSHGSLFVFIIGIYGTQARIFRFDHAGAVCSSAFDYTTVDGSRLFHEFLWRFTHPVYAGCTVVGADPSVTLVGPECRADVVKMLRTAGLKHKDTDEASKAYRYITSRCSGCRKKRYLAYELVFINPHLFSRATTVWQAIEIESNGSNEKAVGGPVVIKESWRQLARGLETDNYVEIFKTDANTPGVAAFCGGDDLGANEIRSLKHGRPGGQEAGHLTVTARHFDNGERRHANYERSHSRLVLGTVGTPLSHFQSTKEMAMAIRDAIIGHRTAFEAGILHRDISEGNIMISRDPKSGCTGFLQDFDYGMNWKKLLTSLNLGTEVEAWEQFVQEECSKIRQKFAERQGTESLTSDGDDANEGNGDDADDGDDHKDGKDGEGEDGEDDEDDEDFHDYVLDHLEFYSRPQESRLGTGGRPGIADFEDGDSADGQSNDDDDEGEEDEEDEEVLDAPGGVKITSQNGVRPDVEAPSTEELRLKCKQRTGTLYFMAVEIIQGDIVHEVRHDLESFFWLLVWLVLRHTAHDDPEGVRACESLFDGESDGVCMKKKRGFLCTMSYFSVKGNKPLNRLLRSFGELCRRNDATAVDVPFEPLTYNGVLALFNDALNKQWPKNDKAIPFVLPKQDPDITFPSGSARYASDIQSSRVASGTQNSHEPINVSQPRRGGQSRRGNAIPVHVRIRESVQGSGGSSRAIDGSHTCKRSREQQETSAVEVNTQSLRSKRTKTDSDRQRRATRGGRQRSSRR